MSPWEIERDPDDTDQIRADKMARKMEMAKTVLPNLIAKSLPSSLGIQNPQRGGSLAGLVPRLATNSVQVVPVPFDAATGSKVSGSINLPPVFRCVYILLSSLWSSHYSFTSILHLSVMSCSALFHFLLFMSGSLHSLWMDPQGKELCYPILGKSISWASSLSVSIQKY